MTWNWIFFSQWNDSLSDDSFLSCQDAERFTFSSGFEEGRDRCPYDPAKGYTGLLVGRPRLPDSLSTCRVLLWKQSLLETKVPYQVFNRNTRRGPPHDILSVCFIYIYLYIYYIICFTRSFFCFTVALKSFVKLLKLDYHWDINLYATERRIYEDSYWFKPNFKMYFCTEDCGFCDLWLQQTTLSLYMWASILYNAAELR